MVSISRVPASELTISAAATTLVDKMEMSFELSLEGLQRGGWSD